MDLGSLLLILALLILVALFIARPFFDREPARSMPAAEQPSGRLTSALLAERDRVLTALQELDFDHSLGKIPEADYPAQRAALFHKGADILRQLDQINQETPNGDLDDRIEAAIAARRADFPLQKEATSAANISASDPADDPLEKMLAEKRRKRGEKSVGFCPHCGGPVHKSDLFCPNCGTAIS